MMTCRRFVPALLVSLFALISAAVIGCGGPAAPGGPGSSGGDDKSLNIGFIYVGPKDDYGYNRPTPRCRRRQEDARRQGHGRGESRRNARRAKTMKSMVEMDGATLLFPTSFGYFDPHVLKMAKVSEGHVPALRRPVDGAKHPTNVGSYFGYIDECQYVSGIVAGLTTKKKKLGFIAAKPIPQVLRNINAFALGARSVNPDVTVAVIFTGDWSKPVAEAEATNGLLDQGADVFTCHVDSPKVIVETAEKRGAYVCGYHCSQATLAPKGYLTGAEWNWEKVYTDYVKDVKAGKKVPNLVRGGLKEGVVKMSPYGAPVSAEAKKAADEAKAKLMAGNFSIFKGPLKDNTGKEILPAGKELAQTAIELESMDYLVDGVIGKTK